jgi:DNA-binding NtrC family response regulator
LNAFNAVLEAGSDPHPREVLVANRLEVLIVSADLETCRILASVLSQWGVEPNFCSTVNEAVELLGMRAASLIFCEDHLADGSFRDVLKAVQSAVPAGRVVVTTRNGCRNEAFRLGAFSVISCPCRSTDVRETIFQSILNEDIASLT